MGLKVWLAILCKKNCCRRCHLWQPCVNQKTLCHGVVASPAIRWLLLFSRCETKKLYPPNLMCVPVCICGLGCLSLVTVENQIITMIRFHYPQDARPLSVFFFPTAVHPIQLTPRTMNMQTENTPNGKGKSSEPNHFEVLYVNPIFGGCIQEKGSPNRIPLRFLAPSNFPLRTRETERHQSRNCSYII